MDLPNIKYLGDVSHFITTEEDEYASILYFKDLEYFEDETLYSKFVSAVEREVRHSEDYGTFVDWIKDGLGINFCQVSSQIFSSDATIEMHHGPLFTLYDICSIILNWFLKRGSKINTFRVADKVLEEHFALRVQVIMMTVTNHEAAHNRDLFNHISQGIGDSASFLQLYSDCLDDLHKYKIWNYLNVCKNNPSFDQGILDVDHIERMISL